MPPVICSALGLKNVNFPSSLATNTPSLILLRMVSHEQGLVLLLGDRPF